MNKDHDDEATMPAATRSKYRYVMIGAILLIVVAMIIGVIIGAIVN